MNEKHTIDVSPDGELGINKNVTVDACGSDIHVSGNRRTPIQYRDRPGDD